MAEIKVLNKMFEESGVFKIDIPLTSEGINVPVVHQVVKAILAGRRQGTACTKSRAQVRGGGIKPYKQKGTGRARQGSIRSPLLVGGGVAFGPTPRDYSQKVNKKVMKKALLSVLIDKHQAGKLTVIDEVASTGKTKDLFKKLETRGLLSTYIIVGNKDSLALRAVKNIATASGAHVDGFSVYDAIKYENLIVERSALEALINRVV